MSVMMRDVTMRFAVAISNTDTDYQNLVLMTTFRRSLDPQLLETSSENRTSSHTP